MASLRLEREAWREDAFSVGRAQCVKVLDRFNPKRGRGYSWFTKVASRAIQKWRAKEMREQHESLDELGSTNDR